MRKLADIPNTDAPSTNYPGGRIRNNNNSTVPPIIGTPIVEELYGDMVQFFQRLLVMGNVTPNELPDNVTNGYQLIEALIKTLNGGYLMRTIEIGPWNMESVGFKEIDLSNYGLIADIRILGGYIIDDNPNNKRELPLFMTNGGYWEKGITDNYLILYRYDGGRYDSVTHESTSINRGFLTFLYKP